jgi:hypothetical protein
MRTDTMDRVESPTARKFAQGVVGIHTNEDRNPSDVFHALSRWCPMQAGGLAQVMR